jgi:hypothetical protein
MRLACIEKRKEIEEDERESKAAWVTKHSTTTTPCRHPYNYATTGQLHAAHDALRIRWPAG